jgi:hypothetical protein
MRLQTTVQLAAVLLVLCVIAPNAASAQCYGPRWGPRYYAPHVAPCYPCYGPVYYNHCHAPRVFVHSHYYRRRGCW